MTGPHLSNSSAAVLGMVALGARSGYDIRRAAERSVRFFWALGPPQIYAELRRLESDGLVEGRDDARGGRARRVFELTAAGREALRRWLTADDDVGALEIRDPELLRLFFADAVGRDDVLAHADRIRRRSEDALEHFAREIAPAAARTREAGAEFPEHVATFGRELHEFIVDWCDRLQATVAANGRKG
ncbi:MAG TPA: PadR family transcriptional regulator [Solirubrobacteraceae bacterium]|jgi:DNA-binding PadR family transcriptional regulator